MLEQLRKSSRTIVAIQIRQGDYWQYADCDWAFIAPTQWYLDWLEEIWDGLEDPVLVVCSDQLENILSDFEKFDPVTTTELDPEVCCEMATGGMSFFPDVYLLSHCDVMAVSGSSFAIVPAMLNERCQRFYRPDLASGGLTAFNPWDTTVYNHTVGEDRLRSIWGRLWYRRENLRRMAAAHGARVLAHQVMGRAHRRVAYELGAVLASGFVQTMRLVNWITSKCFGRKVSPLDVFKTDRLLRFFTKKFNR
jgi:hypothetical protein